MKISLFHRLLCISFSLICHLHGRYVTDIDHFIRDLIIQYYEFHIMKSNTIMNCSSHYKTIVSLTHSTPCMYLMTYGRQFYHFLSDPYISYKKLKWKTAFRFAVPAYKNQGYWVAAIYEHGYQVEA